MERRGLRHWSFDSLDEALSALSEWMIWRNQRRKRFDRGWIASLCVFAAYDVVAVITQPPAPSLRTLLYVLTGLPMCCFSLAAMYGAVTLDRRLQGIVNGLLAFDGTEVVWAVFPHIWALDRETRGRAIRVLTGLLERYRAPLSREIDENRRAILKETYQLVSRPNGEWYDASFAEAIQRATQGDCKRSDREGEISAV